MRRLAIIVTHPIQYYVPIFRELEADPEVDLLVFYTKDASETKFDLGFAKEVEWDIDLHSGYSHRTFKASSWGGKFKLIKNLKLFRPEAVWVIGWNPPGHLLTMWIARCFTRVWFRGDSHFLDKAPAWKSLLRSIALGVIYLPVHKAFYVGDANLDYYKRCGFKEKHLVKAPHAIDQEAFRRNIAGRTKSEVRRRFSLDAGQFVIGYAGKFEEKKFPTGILSAFKKAKLDGTLLVMVGTGPQADVLKKLAQGCSDVHFLGFINQSSMADFLFSCDVLVLPSLYDETWGLIVNEALAVGTPVIISDAVGCMSDMRRYGPQCVEVVPRGSIDDLAEALVAMKLRLERHETSEIQQWCSEASSHFRIERIARALSNELNR
jgi:glycosyltransferase involved in cell wall biosynthesis